MDDQDNKKSHVSLRVVVAVIVSLVLLVLLVLGLSRAGFVRLGGPTWQEYTDADTKQIYWFNHVTGESSWTKPAELDTLPVPKVASIWQEHTDEKVGNR